MTNKEKEAIKIVLDLYRDEVVDIDKAFVLLETILSSDTKETQIWTYPWSTPQPQLLEPYYKEDKHVYRQDLFKPYCKDSSSKPSKWYENVTIKNNQNYTTTDTFSTGNKKDETNKVAF